MKNVLILAASKADGNYAELSQVLEDTGSFVVCSSGPCVSWREAVQLAEFYHPDAVLLTSIVGGISAGDLLHCFRKSGFLGVAVIRRSFSGSMEEIVSAIYHGFRESPYTWKDPWESPQNANYIRLREETRRAQYF